MPGNPDGALGRRPRSRLWQRVGVGAAALALSIVAIELAFRLAGFDFARKERVLEDVPIFYRRPTVPFGEAFFRREGPAEWRGKVLTAMLQRHRVNPRWIPEEEVLSIRYDADGFRNPENLADWEVVVVGDSFTELGHLAFADLFTTRVGKQLGVRVKNLGVSYTGTLTHVEYLKTFGGAPSARHAVLAFFEGNDIDNIVRERSWLAQARRLGRGAKERSSAMAPQSSFLRALYEVATAAPDPPLVVLPNYRFHAEPGGPGTAVTVNYRPPAASELEDPERALLSIALRNWSQTAQSMGMTPWMLYIPAKRRILHGHLEPLWAGQGKEKDKDWTPTDLPELLEDLADRNGILFVDTSAALRAPVPAALPYSAVLDTHVNQLGSRIIADVLAAALARAGVGIAGSDVDPNNPSGEVR